MAVDVARLEELARGATPGPWLVSKARMCIDTAQIGSDGNAYDAYSIAPCISADDPEAVEAWERDAALIVACSPDTILALCERVRVAEATIETERDEWHVAVREARIEKARREAMRGEGAMPLIFLTTRERELLGEDRARAIMAMDEKRRADIAQNAAVMASMNRSREQLAMEVINLRRDKARADRLAGLLRAAFPIIDRAEYDSPLAYECRAALEGK